MCRGEHFADEEHVISRGMERVMTALEPCRAAFDERRAGPIEPKLDAGEPILMRARETPREPDLIAGEHVDGIALGCLERREAPRMQREAPDHEWRLERNRIE